jgi:hypothetical protein
MSRIQYKEDENQQKHLFHLRARPEEEKEFGCISRKVVLSRKIYFHNGYFGLKNIESQQQVAIISDSILCKICTWREMMFSLFAVVGLKMYTWQCVSTTNFI